MRRLPRGLLANPGYRARVGGTWRQREDRIGARARISRRDSDLPAPVVGDLDAVHILRLYIGRVEIRGRWLQPRMNRLRDGLFDRRKSIHALRHLGADGIILVRGDGQCEQDCEDRDHDHQLDQGKPALPLVAHFCMAQGIVRDLIHSITGEGRIET